MVSPISSTDLTNSYLRLYELQKESLYKRRDIEWKVSIAFWTAIGAATAFMVPQVQIPFYSFWFFICVFVVYSLWLYQMSRAHQIDKRWIDVYRSHAEQTLGLRQDVISYTEPSTKDCLTNLWVLTEVAITALFLFASWYLLSRM